MVFDASFGWVEPNSSIETGRCAFCTGFFPFLTTSPLEFIFCVVGRFAKSEEFDDFTVSRDFDDIFARQISFPFIGKVERF